MRILPPSAFVTSPWKNGGGVTHEIARGDLPNGDWRWRLSIAEVAQDGPFSRFDGMARILTVIEGAGIDLHHPNGTLSARLHQPLAFSGDLAVQSEMVDGPIRDFNVIYDPRLCRASARLIAGPAHLSFGPDMTGFLTLSGPVLANGVLLQTGAIALGTSGDVEVQDASLGLLVTLGDLA
jgi:hypothetical protein